MTQSQVFTIGHSNQELDEFLDLLQNSCIDAVVDVRSHPGSAWSPQFNRANLSVKLKSEEVQYAFMGGQLGVRSQDSSLFEDGRISYRRLAESSVFKEGLQQVVRASAKRQIALMCSEQDPLACHRSVLIAPLLEQADVRVVHILRSGDLISQDQLVEQLLREENLDQPDLFESRESRVNSAFQQRERVIAWRSNEIAGEPIH